MEKQLEDKSHERSDAAYKAAYDALKTIKKLKPHHFFKPLSESEQKELIEKLRKDFELLEDDGYAAIEFFGRLDSDRLEKVFGKTLDSISPDVKHIEYEPIHANNEFSTTNLSIFEPPWPKYTEHNMEIVKGLISALIARIDAEKYLRVENSTIQ